MGLITHFVAALAPRLGHGGAGQVVSLATIAAILGRIATGFVIDRVDPRLVALAVQISGVALLATTTSDGGLYLGGILFGLGIGNLVTLPSLVLQREWPREQFAGLISLLLAVNQFTFAFGPALIGIVRDWTGSYAPALGFCIALHVVAAVWILAGPGVPTASRA